MKLHSIIPPGMQERLHKAVKEGDTSFFASDKKSKVKPQIEGPAPDEPTRSQLISPPRNVPPTVRRSASEALINAIKKGDLRGVRDAIEQGADVNTKEHGSFGKTALKLAIKAGDKEIRKILEANGAKRWGMTRGVRRGILIGAAALAGVTVATVRLYPPARERAYTAMQLLSDKNALMLAVESGDLDVVKTLITGGANVNDGHVLLSAVEKGHREVVKLLIESGANVNAIMDQGIDRTTALRSAAEKGHLEVVKLLIASGANINAEVIYEDVRTTALLSAAKKDQKEVVKFLLSAGAEIRGETLIEDTVGSLFLNEIKKSRQKTEPAVHGGTLESMPSIAQ